MYNRINNDKNKDKGKRRKKMKVLIINGSPRPQGNTKIALDEMVKIFDQEGIESEIVHVVNKDIRGCIACM